jgi:hypothetical protein
VSLTKERLVLMGCAGVGTIAGGIIVNRSWDASSLSSHRWAAVGTVAAMAVAATAIGGLAGSRPRPGLVPLLIGAAQFTIYCCVPETDQIPDVSGAVVLLLIVELGIRRAVPWWLHTALFGFVLWTGIYGATGRESALVGALFAGWPLVLAAVVARRQFAATAIGAVAAVVVARTGALQPTVEPAMVAVAIAAPVSAITAWLASRQRGAHPLDGSS